MNQEKSPAIDFLIPDWPAPANIRALTTLRDGGVSVGPWASLNLAAHVGDDPAAVSENRVRLMRAAQIPAAPCWLEQVHGTRAIDAADWFPGIEADAVWSTQPGQVCVVLTADCLPVLLCDRTGSRVAAVHAGWRGLAAGVIEATLRGMGGDPGEILAWLGPAIGPASFEVGAEVQACFVDADPAAAALFRPGRPGRWLADIYGLARLRLAAAGVTAVFGGGWCTLRQPERFYSYRREHTTGRMASLLWAV